MRIIGIDPGSRATGYGVIDLEGTRLRWVASGVIRSGDGSLASRLARIHRTLLGVISENQPSTAALEAVFSHRNPRSAILLGHARGVALGVCGLAGLEATEYAPSQVKSAVVGYGGAAKVQVQAMVQRLLGLPSCPGVDEADALAVAICHGHGHSARGRVRSSQARRGTRR